MLPPKLVVAGLNPYAPHPETCPLAEDTTLDPAFLLRTPLEPACPQQTPAGPHMPTIDTTWTHVIATDLTSHACCGLTHYHHSCAVTPALEPNFSTSAPGLSGRNYAEEPRSRCSLPCPRPIRIEDLRILKRLQICRNSRW